MEVTDSAPAPTPAPTPTPDDDGGGGEEADEIVVDVEPSPDFPVLGSIIGEEEPQFLPGIPNHFFLGIDLRKDDEREEVLYLQRFLNQIGFQVASSGPGSPGNETSFFGPLTETAVIRFQEHYASEVLAPWGITQGTGFVGPSTREKLNDLLVEAYANASSEPFEDDGWEPPAYWEQREFLSLEEFLTALDLSLTVSPVPWVPAYTVVTKTPGGISWVYKAYQGSKFLRFTVRGIHVTEETVTGLVKLEQRIDKAPSSLWWFKRALQAQKEVLNKRVGYQNLRCIECPIVGGRHVDGIVSATANLGGKTLRNGDLLEIKDYRSPASIYKGMSGGNQPLIRQIADYAKHAETTGNKVFVAFTKQQNARAINQLKESLRKAGALDRVEIINGL